MPGEAGNDARTGLKVFSPIVTATVKPEDVAIQSLSADELKKDRRKQFRHHHALSTPDCASGVNSGSRNGKSGFRSWRLQQKL